MQTHKLSRISKPQKRRGARRALQASSRSRPYALKVRRRLIPTYSLLDDAALETIEQHADWLLEHVGMEFRGDETAKELFRNAGAIVDNDRVRYPSGLARELCKTAPTTFKLHGREPEYTVSLGGDGIVFMPGYGSPFVCDLDQGRRYATLNDFRNFVKLTHSTPYLHHSGGTVVEPVDVPVNKRHLDMTLAHLCLSNKPFMGAVTAQERAVDSIAMAEIVFGPDFMQRHVVMQGNININSPFVFDESMSSALRTYAQVNQCVCVSPAIFGGAMGPVTPAAIAAQTLAEAMTGIALAQLVRPGCPVVFGSFHSTMNLRTGSLTFGTPEANLVTMALSQLGHRLGVPVRSGGGQITASNLPDAQAQADSTNAMWSTVISGAHQVWHAAGWLEGGLTMSYEKFILDLDNCGSMLRMLQGMSVSTETLSPESYNEAQPGENFLSTSHTLANYSDANYESLLPDPGSYEAWKENGSPSDAERANRVWKQMLADYEEPPMDEGTRKQLEEFVTSRKSEMPDEWY
ncbi:MAG: trimethylamine methyltransferase family protein [Pseudomonadota bacterium]